MARRWKEEIDTILVFSGLFSAVLTSFNVVLYPALSPNPPVDLSVRILAHMSAQLDTMSSNNDAIPPTWAHQLSESADDIPAFVVWINTFWFASLILSLCTASIALVVRQWLNRFASPWVTSDPFENAYIHHLRYNRGLLPWRVPTILGLLPILMQLALVLFLAGIVILLWTLNAAVAGIATALAALLVLFLVATIVAPAFGPTCPYKSPQALPFYWLVQRIGATCAMRRTHAAYGRPLRAGVHVPMHGAWLAQEHALLRDELPRWRTQIETDPAGLGDEVAYDDVLQSVLADLHAAQSASRDAR